MDQYILYVSFVLAVLAIIFFLIQSIRMNNLIRKYKSFMQGLGNKDVENLMTSYLNELEILKKDVRIQMNRRLDEIEKKLPYCVQNVGIVNYNAFDNVANEMSFSAAMLDGRKDGFIITGIYSRDFAYVYTKEVKNGKSQKELSREEIEALNKAQDKYEI